MFFKNGRELFCGGAGEVMKRRGDRTPSECSPPVMNMDRIRTIYCTLVAPDPATFDQPGF